MVGYSQPAVYDSMTRARANGHEWADIYRYMRDGTATALANGHSKLAVDRYLGYPPEMKLAANPGVPNAPATAADTAGT